MRETPATSNEKLVIDSLTRELNIQRQVLMSFVTDAGGLMATPRDLNLPYDAEIETRAEQISQRIMRQVRVIAEIAALIKALEEGNVLLAAAPLAPEDKP